MKFTLGCLLINHIAPPMPFVFNVATASFTGQNIQHWPRSPAYTILWPKFAKVLAEDPDIKVEISIE
jgi:hypothetical protein